MYSGYLFAVQHLERSQLRQGLLILVHTIIIDWTFSISMIGWNVYIFKIIMSPINSVKWWLIVIATLFSLISITTTSTMTNSIVPSKLPLEIQRAFFFRNFTPESPSQQTQPTTYNIYDVDSNFSFNSFFQHCEVYSLFDQKVDSFPKSRPRNSSIDLYTTFYDILKDQTHFNGYNNFWPPKAIVHRLFSLKHFSFKVNPSIFG